MSINYFIAIRKDSNDDALKVTLSTYCEFPIIITVFPLSGLIASSGVEHEKKL